MTVTSKSSTNESEQQISFSSVVAAWYPVALYMATCCFSPVESLIIPFTLFAEREASSIFSCRALCFNFFSNVLNCCPREIFPRGYNE